MKRNYLKVLYVAVIALILPSCDKDFEEININPHASTEVVPEFLFTKAQLDAVSVNFTGAAYLTIGGSMQHFATYKEVPAAGDKYFNQGYSTGNWNAYSGAVIQLQQIMEAVSEKPEDINKLSVARIWRAYIFHRLTDLYGDIPYSEAGQALTEKNYTPVYDQQSFIYNDMLKELEEAAAALNPSMPTFGSSDLIYGGNTEKWKKFAYSLMLRLGMRLTEVDEAAAKVWVEKAIAGGLILEDDDIAIIEYIDGTQVSSRNFIANGLMNIDYLNPQNEDNVEGGKLAKTLIDHLKATNDPRLNVWSVVWVKTGTGVYVADTATALQKGMPNAVYNNYPADFGTYSEPHPNTLLRRDSPLLVFTNAEVNLLLAEAAIRGWYAGNTAEELYHNAIAAGMRQWALFGPDGVISDSRINQYIQQNAFLTGGTFEQQLEQIQTQKWVSLFLEDEYEIFASWRRTGYPQLTPTNYPGNLTGGTIPRRFVIPDSEEIYNRENFLEARTRQGGNNLFTSRVWWDKE